MPELVQECLEQTPGLDSFFVPKNSFFIGGTAPYTYDDENGQGGIMPTAEHLREIARIAELSSSVSGMGKGVKLKDELEQLEIMLQECSKSAYLGLQSRQGIERAREIHAQRKNLMVVFCLTKPPLAICSCSQTWVLLCQSISCPLCRPCLALLGLLVTQSSRSKAERLSFCLNPADEGLQGLFMCDV
ncbi:MAG: hypothetical protein ACOC43_01845 [Desulfohalobiaceae bacterium]